MPLLSILIFGPLLVAAILAFIPRHDVGLQKAVALGGAVALFLISLLLFTGYSGAGYLFTENHAWISTSVFTSRYKVGVDGISLFLVILTTLLTPISLMASWSSIKTRVREYLIFMLVLETGVIGVFAARDMFLFYAFWEFQLIPMYFLIGIWGGANRIYATLKFFLYTLVGSLLMLVAILWLWNTAGRTFDIDTLIKNAGTPIQVQTWLFLAFALAFAIKVPLFPLHTWLPDAHTEAPTAGSVMLAGVLLKMGTYGFLRFCFPLFPEASRAFAPLFMTLAVIGIIYGAIVAAVQPDMKKLVAYSSVSHLGFVMLGLFAFNAQAWQGAVMQMVNHGISTGALFLLVGVLYDQRHTRLIREYGGVASITPLFNVVFLTAVLSSAGLPALNGFVGEFNILLGAFQASPGLTIAATTGVILAAVYLLWMFQRVMHGNVTHEENRKLKDLTHWQMAYLAPLLFLMVWLGVHPNTILSRTQGAVMATLESSRVPGSTGSQPALQPQAVSFEGGPAR
ncbi:MAG TPA: NADH-quinone oxidoreductase subunit M [Armatimonadota bacterium]|jgi:NADH-quinone oxidoreductase subunit M